MLAVFTVILAGCEPRKSPEASMDDFFGQLQKKNYKEAYASTSVAFQAQLGAKQFEAIVRDTNLDTPLAIAWTTQTTSNKEVILKGVAQTGNSETEFYADLLKEYGAWRLYSLSTPATDDPKKLVDIFNRMNHGLTFNDTFTRKVPNDEEARALVTDTVQKFNECLHKKDFKSFYEYTSALWQAQTSEEQVSKAFKGFIDNNITLDYLKDTKAVFDEPPRFDSDGHLLIKGYYPTQPNRVVFSFKYIFELPKWRLLGVTLKMEQQ